MLADLKKVEDNFYGNQSIEQFLKVPIILVRLGLFMK